MTQSMRFILSEERVGASAASVAAAIQHVDAALANKIRSYAALVAAVPISLLAPRRISRGIIGSAGTS
jgi:hypothetical protein